MPPTVASDHKPVRWKANYQHGAIALCLIASTFIGCQENPFRQNPLVLQGQIGQLQQQQTQLAARGKELESRAVDLDRNNQQIEALLAQSQQREQLAQEQLAALREQLASVSSQLASVQAAKESADHKVETFLAAQRKRAGTIITANNNLSDSLPEFSLPGIQARQDGDVIRVELPSDELFQPGTGRLGASASRILDEVAREIEVNYSLQMIGIEGHTSRDAAAAFQPPSHKLSADQAEAVFDYFVNRARISSDRLFFTGHGANHPVYSNTSEAGRRKNRRIEVVIYPERYTD